MELTIDAIMLDRFVKQVQFQFLFRVLPQPFWSSNKAEFIERCLFVERLLHLYCELIIDNNKVNNNTKS